MKQRQNANLRSYLVRKTWNFSIQFLCVVIGTISKSIMEGKWKKNPTILSASSAHGARLWAKD